VSALAMILRSLFCMHAMEIAEIYVCIEVAIGYSFPVLI